MPGERGCVGAVVMAIDVRARMVCSLGHVLSGEVSNSMIGEGGLIKTSGSLVLDGTVMPVRGTVVQLAYYQPQYGTITRFPRPLRVLKAVADPFRRQTAIDVGCKLTLMEAFVDKKDLFKAGLNPPPWYTALSPADKAKVAPTIMGQSLLQHCLSKIGISLASSSTPLRFQFRRADYGLDDGYVNVINDLIRSERCYGFLDQAERLVVKLITLERVSSAPVIQQDDLIDLQPNSGVVEPDDFVNVSYQAKQVKR